MPRLLLGSGVTAAEPDGQGADGRGADGRAAGWRVPGRAVLPRLSLLATDGWLSGRGRLLPAIQATEPSAMSTATTATASRVRPVTGAVGGSGSWTVAGGSGSRAKSASQVVLSGMPERSGLAGSGLAGSGLAGSGLAGSGLGGSGLAGSGLGGSGLAGSGLAGSGLGGSGLAGSGPWDSVTGRPGEGAGTAAWAAPTRAASSSGSGMRRIRAPQWVQYRRVPLTGVPHAVQNLIAVSRT